MNFSINIVDSINKNSGIVTLTGKAPYRLTTTTKYGGFKGEQKIYNIKGSTSSKSRIIIATIKIEASHATAREFIQAPSLSSRYNIKLIQKSIEQKTADYGGDRDYVYSYLFDVVYFNTVSIGRQDSATAVLVYKDSLVPARIGGALNFITSLTFGSIMLSRSGERRQINVTGSPGATATLTIKDDNNNSILADLENGEIVDSYSFTIDESGVYSFPQTFPSIVSKGTAVNDSGASGGGAANIIFDDLTGVQVGDRVMLASSSDETVSNVVTVLNPNGNNENQCTISPNLTVADNALVLFKRSRKYKINIETSSGLASDIPTTTPTYTLCQYRNPVLTLKAEGNTAYTITQFNDAATSLGSGAAHYHEKKYAGIANFTSEQTERFSRVKETISFKYLLTAAGGKNFTGFTKPVFNQDVTSELAANQNKISHWTNSVPGSNGGTDVHITANATSDLNETTLTIEGTIAVNQWGNDDVTMAIDFNKLLTYS